MEEKSTPVAKHPLRARLIVGIVMLILAFLGVIITSIYTTGGWLYWKISIPIYALLALWLSWYLRRTKEATNPITLWHELLHWIGLFSTIVLVEIFVQEGFLGRSLAGLFSLTLLSLTVFTLGVYIESTFLLIGIVLGFFAAIVAIAMKYLYAFTIPALLIGIAVIAYMFFRAKKKSTEGS